jgi:hypothetical protein
MKFYKIFTNNDIHNRFKYKNGLNVDTNEFESDPTKSCCIGGLYFSNKENILKFMPFGNFIREVEVPEGNEIVLDPSGDKYRAHALFLHRRKDLRKLSTWKWIIKQGICINDKKNTVLTMLIIMGSLEVVKFLVDNGSINVINNDYILASAIERGHLTLVQYLVEHGADVTASDNYAIKMASKYGRLDIVKYLIEHGADITVDNNCIVKRAHFTGQDKSVKLLLEYGAKL